MIKTVAAMLVLVPVGFAQIKLDTPNKQVKGTLAPVNGGTGHNTFTKGDILCALSSSAFSKLAVGTNTYVLTADSTATCGVRWASPTGAAQPYVIALYVPGTQTNSQLFFVHTPPLAISVASGCTNSVATLESAATGSTTYTIKKNGSSVGTIVFSAGGTTSSFTCASSFSLNGTTDKLTLTGPSTADATAAGLAVSIYATR